MFHGTRVICIECERKNQNQDVIRERKKQTNKRGYHTMNSCQKTHRATLHSFCHFTKLNSKFMRMNSPRMHACTLKSKPHQQPTSFESNSHGFSYIFPILGPNFMLFAIHKWHFISKIVCN